MRKYNCIEFDYKGLPAHIKEEVLGWCGFHNDCYLEVYSECCPEDGDDWYNALEEIENYIKNDGYEPDVIEKWIMGLDLNLKGVQKIFIRICW
jgi:hypothetical protein